MVYYQIRGEETDKSESNIKVHCALKSIWGNRLYLYFSLYVYSSVSTYVEEVVIFVIIIWSYEFTNWTTLYYIVGEGFLSSFHLKLEHFTNGRVPPGIRIHPTSRKRDVNRDQIRTRVYLGNTEVSPTDITQNVLIAGNTLQTIHSTWNVCVVTDETLHIKWTGQRGITLVSMNQSTSPSLCRFNNEYITQSLGVY